MTKRKRNATTIPALNEAKKRKTGKGVIDERISQEDAEMARKKVAKEEKRARKEAKRLRRLEKAASKGLQRVTSDQLQSRNAKANQQRAKSSEQQVLPLPIVEAVLAKQDRDEDEEATEEKARKKEAKEEKRARKEAKRLRRLEKAASKGLQRVTSDQLQSRNAKANQQRAKSSEQQVLPLPIVEAVLAKQHRDEDEEATEEKARKKKAKKKRKKEKKAKKAKKQTRDLAENVPSVNMEIDARKKKWEVVNDASQIPEKRSFREKGAAFNEGKFMTAERNALISSLHQHLDSVGKDDHTEGYRWLLEQTASNCKGRKNTDVIEICSVLKSRTIRSSYLFLKRWMETKLKKSGPWSSEEVQSLRTLVASMDSKWAEIGMALDRPADAVRDKWKQISSSSFKTGKWSEAEAKRFREILAEVWGDKVPKQGIPWVEMSRRMETRSATSCRSHYEKSVFSSIQKKGAFGFFTEDEDEMLRNIEEQGAEEICDIDFSKVCTRFGTAHSRAHFLIMLKRVARSERLSLDANIEALKFHGEDKDVSEGE